MTTKKQTQKELLHVKLDDKYTLETGTAFLTGTQALVRLPLMRRKADMAKKLNTAGFISGYRGSPLARLDQQLWAAESLLKEHHITFTSGINEELGATAVWGSQMSNLYEGAQYDGIFGMWYGKGPGVDRALDCFKHAHANGTSKNGGFLAIVGDDHACVSSTLGHQSEQALASADIPTLYPSSIQEYLDYGMIGWDMSRYTGGIVALKCISEIVESSASVVLNKTFKTIEPKDFKKSEDLNVHYPDNRFDQEKRLKEKSEAAKAFAYENNIDKIIYKNDKANLGIVTTGKSYLDTLSALEELGLGQTELTNLGVRIYKVGMVWPLEAKRLQEFSKGLERILVIEEKRPTIEKQLKEILFDTDMRPQVTGKHDLNKFYQLPIHSELSIAQIARAIVNHLGVAKQGNVIINRLNQLAQKDVEMADHINKSTRLPYYCSGCPHNTSTKVPKGSRGLAGIGCHFMVMWMNRNTNVFSQMGGEGVQWLGQAPFTSEKHVFANLGDGTYEHSGILAIRAAVASKVNMTYKILYNDAVAMTGGQPVEGSSTVNNIAWQLYGERVKEI
ncbi:MAG: indolepyruvate ferredoxin oxidoreductase, partial [bacterium]